MFLLTGGNGQLGTELRHLLDEKNLPYVSTDAKDLDITDAEKTMAYITELKHIKRLILFSAMIVLL